MNIKRYTITLKAEQPIRIGGIDDPLGGIDNQVAMVGNRLCIPGTSLKGAYRNELERWLNATYRDEKGEWRHPSLQPCLTTYEPSKSEENLKNKKNYKDACRYKDDDGGHLCPVCYLLGAPGLVGFVTIPFLFAKTQDRPQALYSSRIDRMSNTVTAGNRSYQFAPPETVFTGELEVILEDPFLKWSFGQKRSVRNENADTWIDHAELGNTDACLDTLIVKRLEAIRRIGGFKSKGFGAISLSVKPKNPS